MCRCAPPAGQHTRAPCCWGGGGGHGSEALGQHAHQLVLGARLAHADVLVTLHGDIGEGDGILLHPQVLELQGRGAQGGGEGAAVGSGSSWRAPLLFQARLPRTLPPFKPARLVRRAGRRAPTVLHNRRPRRSRCSSQRPRHSGRGGQWHSR